MESGRINIRQSGLIFILVFSLVFSAACASNQAEEATIAPKESVSAPELIANAENLYKEREDLAKLRQGIAFLRRARNTDSQNFAAAWKLAQFNYFLGDKATDDKESDRAFKEGLTAAKTAITLQKEKPDGYFWLGANLGGQAKKDVLSGAANIGDIKKNMEKVIELQPDYQGASAFVVLAQVELNTRLIGGSAEKAVELLEKALTLEKGNSMLRLTLAESYLATNKKDEAKKQIDFIQKMTPNPDYLPEHKEVLEKAKKLAEKF